MADLTLYQFEISPFCDKLRRIMAFKGLDFNVVEVAPSRAGKYKHLTPSGKFPVLVHHGTEVGDKVIVDSTDISHYLEKTFPDPSLLPSDPIEMALMHIIEDWADESLYFQEMTMRLLWRNNAERWIPILLQSETGLTRFFAQKLIRGVVKRQAEAQGTGRKSKDQILADLKRHLISLESLLEGKEWLVGEHLTLADIGVFAQIFAIGGSEEGARMISEYPSIVAWISRVDVATVSNKEGDAPDPE